MSEARSALEGLQTHPGWLLFKQEAKRRWGPEGYARELKRAIGVAIEKGKNAEAAIERIDYAQDEINALLTWVDHALVMVTNREAREGAPVPLSRRGPSL